MARIELIGVPFDGYGRRDRQAAASRVLREAGIVRAFDGHEVLDGADVELPDPDPARARTPTAATHVRSSASPKRLARALV